MCASVCVCARARVCVCVRVCNRARACVCMLACIRMCEREKERERVRGYERVMFMHCRCNLCRNVILQCVSFCICILILSYNSSALLEIRSIFSLRVVVTEKQNATAWNYSPRYPAFYRPISNCYIMLVKAANVTGTTCVHTYDSM